MDGFTPCGLVCAVYGIERGEEEVPDLTEVAAAVEYIISPSL